MRSLLLGVFTCVALMSAPALGQAQSVDTLFLQGLAAQYAGDYAQAEVIWRQVLRLAPDSAGAYYNLGNALYGQGRFSEAEAAHREAIRLKPDNAIAYYSLGIALQKQGRSSEAEAAYREAIRLNPDYARAYIGLGNALADQRRLGEAEAAYREAIRLDPDYAAAYINLGVTLSAQGRLAEAEAAFLEAIRLDPNNALAYNNLGATLADRGRYEEAIALYEQALQIDPEYTTAQNNLAEAQRLLALRVTPAPTRQDDLAWLPTNEPLLPVLRAVVRVITETPTGAEIGTGFVVRREGNTIWVLTNRHVVTTVAASRDPDTAADSRALRQAGELSETVDVDFYSVPPPGRVWLRLPATIVEATGPQDELDLALLMIDNAPDDIQPLALGDSDELPRLSDLLVVGHPSAALPWTTETSSLSNRDLQELQISRASLGPGNSGSPILNEQDQVVGILFSTLDASAPGRAAGFGYAYLSDSIKPVLEKWGML